MRHVIDGRERVFPVVPSNDLRNYDHLVGGSPLGGSLQAPDPTKTVLLDRGTIRLDQGNSEACTLFSGGNAWKASKQHGEPSNLQCLLWYHHALTIDEIPGTDPSTGTTANAEGKELRFQQKIKTYGWATSPEAALAQVMGGRPVSWPSVWTYGMAYPVRGIMSLAGAQLGGHMTTIVGWVGPWKLVVIENSWGHTWGNDGLGYLSWENFVTKFWDWPEALVPYF